MRKRSGLFASILFAGAAAEAGVRLLRPRPDTRPAEPVELRSYFSAEEIDRGRRFARPQRALGLARGALELSVLAVVALRPPPLLREQRAHPIAAGVAAGAGLALALSAPPLPLAAIARRRAIAVGLVTQSWRGWLADLAKSSAIEAALAGAGGGLVTATMRRYPRSWWAVGAGGSVVVGILFAALAPVLLDPVFNDYEPLPEGETRGDVLELAQAAGIKVGEVFSVDASRRTTAANAYVTGIGPTKRVVLFDTLLDRYSREEVRVVVAHELAHVRNRDVPRGVLYAALVSPAASLAIKQFADAVTEAQDSPSVLAVLALAAAIVSAPLGLIGNRLSRAIERRADAYSLEATGAAEAFISFERAIALQNVADLDPPAWVTNLMATHPPTTERIAAAVAYQSNNQGRAASPQTN